MKAIDARWFGCVALGLSLLAGCGGGKSAGGGGTGGEGNVATGGSTGAGTGGQSGGQSGGATGTGGNGTAGGNGAGGSVTGAGGAISGAGGAITGAAGAGPLPGVACSGTSPITTTGTAATRLVVDAGQKGQAWNRFYEKVVAADHANTVLTTAYGRNIQAALKKGHDQAGFGSVRFHGILDDDIGVYSEPGGVPTYTWTKVDQIYDAIVAAGMRPFVEISFMPKALASDQTKVQTLLWYNNQSPNISPPRDWTVWQTFMQNLVQHLESRYGAAEVRNNWYFEIWNESSWMYSAGNAGYNQLYQNTVQGLLKADPMLKVGGPAESQGGSTFMVDGIIKFAKTASNNAKLDFVSYHTYGQSNATSLALASPGAAANSATIDFHNTIMNIVKTDAFTGGVFVTEWGPTYSLGNVQSDNEVAASYIAKVIHLLDTNPTSAPPAGFSYWAISDLYEENDTGTNTAFRGGNFGLLLKGDPQIATSFDVAKPAFNAFRLLHLMGDVQVSTTGGTTGNGVNAAATLLADSSALRVLVYSHTDGGTASATDSTLVNLTVNNLPFGAGPLRVRQYIVDHTHANAYTTWVGQGSPAKPTAAQWSALSASAELCYFDTTVTPSGVTPAGNSLSLMFPQNNYSVSLLVISR
jgi:xylan 1,4-beta-xylosidase